MYQLKFKNIIKSYHSYAEAMEYVVENNIRDFRLVKLNKNK